MGIEFVLVNMFLNRIYCPEELLFYEQQIHDKYKLGDIIASHECGHRYRTKKGGIKEAKILYNNTITEKISQKTCSVCFKININNNLEKADLVENRNVVEDNIDTDIIQDVCSQEGTKNPTIKFLENKYIFYQWLYKHLFL